MLPNLNAGDLGGAPKCTPVFKDDIDPFVGSPTAMTGFFALKPGDTTIVRRDYNTIYGVIDTETLRVHTDYFDLPLGVSILLGSSGKGKTKTFNSIMKGLSVRDDVDAYSLEIGEAYNSTPFSLSALMACCRYVAAKAADNFAGGKLTVLLVDSLMGLWTDDLVTSGRAIGASGASLGVPKAILAMQYFLESHAVISLMTLNPQLTNPLMIMGALSGSVAGFINLDNRECVWRDAYDSEVRLWDRSSSIPYIRKGNEQSSDRMAGLSLYLPHLPTEP